MQRRHAVPMVALVVLSGFAAGARANIDIVFDYTYDTGMFFQQQAKRDVLEAAALAFESRFADSLTAITPGSVNSFNANFFNPGNFSPNPANNLSITNFSVAANELRIFVGGSALGGNTLGVGGPGGFGYSGDSAFVDNLLSRGQSGALATPKTDFGPWGGAISFNSATNWYFDSDVSTVEPFTNGYFDFYSVAVHELAHVLGFGLAPSFDAKVSNGSFVGLASGTQALSADLGHWAAGATGMVGAFSQEAAMTTSIAANTRKYFTTLDYAGMSDIGWQVTPIPEPATWLMWGAGGLLLAGLRRRSAQPVA